MENVRNHNGEEVETHKIQVDETKLSYKGFFKYVNQKPDSEYIEMFVSDWNKEHWAFYIYISQDDYETDIENIQNLIDKLNYRDGDYYIELINHSEDLEYFYKYIDEQGKYSHSEVLNLELWEILEDKEDEHFLYFNELNGSSSIDDLRNAEFIVYDDWYDVLENCRPELYKALDEANGLGCFDIESFFYGCNLYRVNGCIVEEIY